MYWISLSIGLIIISSTCVQLHKFNRKPDQLVGGRNPLVSEVKYIVVITDGHGICGGGIIHENFILTAAHCVKSDENTRKLLYPMKIIAGTNVAFGYTKSAVIERDVVKVYQVGPFILDGGKNDIALLELSSPLDLVRNHQRLQKLNLPQPLHKDSFAYPTYENAKIKFAGYGDTHAYTVKFNGKSQFKTVGAGSLQVANAKIEEAAKCEMFVENFRKDQMCLSIVEDKSKTRQQGTCAGDSGSPAVIDNNIVVGVYSMGAWCDTNRAPAIFTRVSYYVPFIKNVINNITENLLVYD